MLHTNEPGIGGASIQPSATCTSSPPTSSCCRMVSSAVVGVLAHAPAASRGVGRCWRVVEDAEQHERIGRVAVGKVRLLQPQAERDAAPSARCPSLRERVDVVEHGLAEAGGSSGNRLRPCSGVPARTRGMIVGQLRAEVEPLLLIGLAGGELVADGEVAPPGPASAAPCGSASCVGSSWAKNWRLNRFQPALQLFDHPVPDDVEEAAVRGRPDR